MSWGLPDGVADRIRGVFARFPQVDRAVLYGSRAKGTFRPGSDIDLTLWGEGLDWRQCSRIAAEVDELLLPWEVDLSVFAELTHAGLREHIERVGVVFYLRREPDAVGSDSVGAGR